VTRDDPPSIGAYEVPLLTLSVTMLDLPATTYGTAGDSVPYTISGHNLTAPTVVITAPAGVQLSTDNSHWSASLTLNTSNGTLAPTTIDVRLGATATAPGVSGVAISNASAGLPEQDVAVSGTVNPAMPVLAVKPVTITSGTALANSQLSGTATWTVGGQPVTVAGSFKYTSALGTVLNLGKGQSEAVTFTPKDGTDYTTASTTVIVNVNAPPTLAVPAARTAFEDVASAIKGLRVGDRAGDRLTVRLRVRHGTLRLGKTAGLSVSGNGRGTVTLSGGSAKLNAALATLSYRGGLNYSGRDTLWVAVSDGSLSAGGRVAITVKSAAQQAAALRARVTALQTAGVLNPSLSLLLAATLDLQGNATDVARVNEFLQGVRMLRGLGILNAAQTEALLGPGGVLLLSVTRR
jgi:hypothetical protein